jgi:hypothetical protein
MKTRGTMGEMNLGPEDLRREIDDTLEEIERIEAEVVELFAEIVGPDAAGIVARYIEAHEQAPRVKPLLRPQGVRGSSAQPNLDPPAGAALWRAIPRSEEWPEPSTAPPATP